MLINTCMSFSGKCPCLLCQHPREECAGGCPKTYGKIDTSKMCGKAKDYCEKVNRNMINNDLISRSALIAEYDRVHVGAPGGARKLMQDAPAVDAVEVVRCKDCKYWHMFKEDFYACRNVNGMNNYGDEDGFCGCGERKDDETD